MSTKRKCTTTEARGRKRRTLLRDIKSEVDVGVCMYPTEGNEFMYLYQTTTRWDIKWTLRKAANIPGTTISRNPIMRYDSICIMHPTEELLDLLIPFELTQEDSRFPWHKVIVRMPID